MWKRCGSHRQGWVRGVFVVPREGNVDWYVSQIRIKTSLDGINRYLENTMASLPPGRAQSNTNHSEPLSFPARRFFMRLRHVEERKEMVNRRHRVSRRTRQNSSSMSQCAIHVAPLPSLITGR